MFNIFCARSCSSYRLCLESDMTSVNVQCNFLLVTVGNYSRKPMIILHSITGKKLRMKNCLKFQLQQHLIEKFQVNRAKKCRLQVTQLTNSLKSSTTSISLVADPFLLKLLKMNDRRQQRFFIFLSFVFRSVLTAV